MIADYHIHTQFCRHADGEPREYVERAIALGMTEMGFSDHLPFLAGWRPSGDLPDDFGMERHELDDYVALVQDLQREYARDMTILLAADLDIPLTFGSDAHRPAEVGYEFTGAGALAREAGYSAVLRLSDGRPQALA